MCYTIIVIGNTNNSYYTIYPKQEGKSGIEIEVIKKFFFYYFRAHDHWTRPNKDLEKVWNAEFLEGVCSVEKEITDEEYKALAEWIPELKREIKRSNYIHSGYSEHRVNLDIGDYEEYAYENGLSEIEAYYERDIESAFPQEENFENCEESLCHRELGRAIDELTDKQKEILIMVEAQGYRKSEVAKLLDVSERNIRKIYERAIASARKRTEGFLKNKHNLKTEERKFLERQAEKRKNNEDS